LLAGVEPAQAVRYQVVIMFLIASATALGTLGVVLLSYRRLFTTAHQFRHDLLGGGDGGG
jgi:putative ABC transport system permease protein